MVGIMGGTFNPIHFGHLRLAEHIREELSLDAVYFMPAGMPPHKDDNIIVSAEHRLEMTRLAIQGNPCFQINDHEIHKHGYSYTVESLEHYKSNGLKDLTLILGADSILQMKLWYKPEIILSIAKIAVAPRPETDLLLLEAAIEELARDYGARVFVSSAVSMPHSSTDIRDRVKKGLSIRYLVPAEVQKYIDANGLYI